MKKAIANNALLFSIVLSSILIYIVASFLMWDFAWINGISTCGVGFRVGGLVIFVAVIASVWGIINERYKSYKTHH